MYKRTIADKAGKRILSVVLAAVMVVPLLTGVTAKDMSKVEAAAALHNPSKGSNGVVTWDCVYFGRYPQSDATGKTSEAIKWRVLSVNGNDVFLMADSNLDAQRYHEYVAETTWENSIMRCWLNGYSSTSNLAKLECRTNGFLPRAFTETEQNAIITTTVTNPGSTYGTAQIPGCNDTQDKVYLLSYEEAKNTAYGFDASDDDDPARIRKNTAYVKAGGSTQSPLVAPTDETGFWWLRTPGNSQKRYRIIGTTGAVNQAGRYVGDRLLVCPVLHLDITNTKLWSFAGTVGSDGSSTPGEAPPVVDIQAKDPNTGATYVPNNESGTDKTVEYNKAPESGNVVVPETVKINGETYTVTSIADNAFKNNKKIERIVIGTNIKTIGENAFMGCSNLQYVTIGKNVTTIKAKAFYKCKKLKSITIPSKVNKIGKQAFYGCKNLKTINIKTTKLTSKNVGSKAFKGIHSKATIKVPKKKLSAYKKLLKAKGVGSKATIKK